MLFLRPILLFFALTLTTSCTHSLFSSASKVNHSYLPKNFKGDFQSFFNGDIEGFSIIKDKDGNITNARKISVSGSWEDNKGIIRKKFTDKDNKKTSRTWLLTLNPDGSFTAIGHDALNGAKGTTTGNMTHINYRLSLDINENKSPTTYDENMYLIDGDSMIMITKFESDNGDKGKEITSLKKQVVKDSVEEVIQN